MLSVFWIKDFSRFGSTAARRPKGNLCNYRAVRSREETSVWRYCRTPGRTSEGRRHRHASVLGLPRAADHSDRPLPAGRGRAQVRHLEAQQHVLTARPRWRPRPRSCGPGLRPAAAGAADPARDLGQLAVSGWPRLGPAQRPHADLHQELSALRGTRSIRELDRVRRLRPDAGRDRFDRRVHAGVVVGIPHIDMVRAAEGLARTPSSPNCHAREDGNP